MKKRKVWMFAAALALVAVTAISGLSQGEFTYMDRAAEGDCDDKVWVCAVVTPDDPDQ